MGREHAYTTLIAFSRVPLRNFLHGFPVAPGEPEVKRVLVMFKCHLDVGFTDTQAGSRANTLRNIPPRHTDGGGHAPVRRRSICLDHRVVVLYEYSGNKPRVRSGGARRTRWRRAIWRGTRCPFTWETETLDRSMIEGAPGVLGIARPAFRPYHHRGEDDGRAGPFARTGGPLGRARSEASRHWC